MNNTHTHHNILPIFVLGLQRSGTTWLANLISSHPDIVSIGSADHRGIHESIFFSHFARAYGDLSNTQNRERFIHDFARSDYYLLSGLEPEWLNNNADQSYTDLFRELMDEVAIRHNAKGWVEKSPHHTLLGDELASSYPDSRFICVIRDYHDMIRSRLWAYGRTPPSYPLRLYKIARACAVNSLYERYIKRFCHDNPRAILISYKDLKDNTIPQINRVFDFLCLKMVDDHFKTEYSANSSFGVGRSKESGLSNLDHFFIAIFKGVMRIAPYTLLRRQEKLERKNAVDWPDWCWKINPR